MLKIFSIHWFCWLSEDTTEAAFQNPAASRIFLFVLLHLALVSVFTPFLPFSFITFIPAHGPFWTTEFLLYESFLNICLGSFPPYTFLRFFFPTPMYVPEVWEEKELLEERECWKKGNAGKCYLKQLRFFTQRTQQVLCFLAECVFPEESLKNWCWVWWIQSSQAGERKGWNSCRLPLAAISPWLRKEAAFSSREDSAVVYSTGRQPKAKSKKSKAVVGEATGAGCGLGDWPSSEKQGRDT